MSRQSCAWLHCNWKDQPFWGWRRADRDLAWRDFQLEGSSEKFSRTVLYHAAHPAGRDRRLHGAVMRQAPGLPHKNRPTSLHAIRCVGECLLAGALLIGTSVSPAVAAPNIPTPEPRANLNPRQAPQLALATPTPPPNTNPQLAPHLEQAPPPPQTNIHNQAGTSVTRKYSTTPRCRRGFGANRQPAARSVRDRR